MLWRGYRETTLNAELDRWVERQLAPWRGADFDGDAVGPCFDAMNANDKDFFVLEARGRDVAVREKKNFYADLTSAVAHDQVAARAFIYKTMLQRALEENRLSIHATIGLDVADFVIERPFPVFSFQKPEGQNNLLLPDVDFFGHFWYPWPLVDSGSGKTIPDPPFEQKLTSAIFAGASTGRGGLLSVDDIMEATIPRLHYAKVLDGNRRIIFKICRAVQCDSSAQQMLEQESYFAPPIGLEEQLRHKFLISIDGNGATCSRLVIALKSNSVLVKFKSPHRLYYFDGLVEGRDYLSISDERDLETIVAEEERRPGTYRQIAQNGKTFCATYLTAEAGHRYVAKLLKAYEAALGLRL